MLQNLNLESTPTKSKCASGKMFKTLHLGCWIGSAPPDSHMTFTPDASSAVRNNNSPSLHVLGVALVGHTPGEPIPVLRTHFNSVGLRGCSSPNSPRHSNSPLPSHSATTVLHGSPKSWLISSAERGFDGEFKKSAAIHTGDLPLALAQHSEKVFMRM
ncbi:hypothetical protein L484_005370 [Morus notabilis]|uniref:Uncharacterized protein n=1 Tax=Morus notabilis TaxID=981085 RepID=W9S394_9ROSA|nr:hypothetical protein L484_005370 [Morus notabilis]